MISEQRFRAAGSGAPAATIGGIPLAEHDHVCAFYRGREERDRLLVSFLHEGVLAGDTCLCIAAGEEHGSLLSAMKAADPEIGPELGRLQLTDPRTTYLRTGAFTAQPMLDLLYDWARTTFDHEGATFARGVGDMTWAAEALSPELVVDLAAYEARLTRWTRSFPQVTVCMYDLDRFGDVVVPVLKTHPKVWMSGVLVQNPYYLDADDVLPAQG